MVSCDSNVTKEKKRHTYKHNMATMKTHLVSLLSFLLLLLLFVSSQVGFTEAIRLPRSTRNRLPFGRMPARPSKSLRGLRFPFGRIPAHPSKSRKGSGG
ncbi:hypothetical protein CARUB_v10006113mg [Capsella rubella]|uniref:Uncharacterized protein n=1 Tax=Capsella rubella TaxID=81985 RepID=R0F7Z1_9BRAS|nr:hypothetical protein CARUB_v10006113mg [Capsella rubella]